MPGTFNDPLSPASKDPAEGARGPADGGEPAKADKDKSKLGRGGDPAEGGRDRVDEEANRAGP